MNALAIFSPLLLASALHAQTARTLTWEESLREASKSNPDLASAREGILSAQARYLGSRSGFFPQLSLSAGYDRSGAEGSLLQEDYSSSLSARQNLFAGGGDLGATNQGRARLEGALAVLQSVRAAVSFELKSAFGRLLYAQEQEALAQAIADRREANVRLVELRYDAGREHKGSFLRIRAAYSQAGFEVAQARRAVRVAQRELATSLGLPVFDVLRATGALRVEIPQSPPDFAELAIRTPAYLLAEAQRRAAEAGVTIARSRLLPDLTASGSIARAGSSWPPGRDRWSAGLSLGLPVFQGWRNVSGLRSARADSRQAAAEARGARNETLLALEESFAAYQDAAQRTEVQREFLEAAEVRSEIARSQYTSGLLSFENWDIIENDLINTQKAYLASLRDAVLAEARWERAQGKGWIP